MITECYIKGRYDNKVGKCAVVIVEAGAVIHQVAWKVPSQWKYDGNVISADQFNCEILAATYAMQWCVNNKKTLVNIYANTNTCTKWYGRAEFPETRAAAAKAYTDVVTRFYECADAVDGTAELHDRICAEWIPKDCDEAKYAEFNHLLNEIAESA